MMTTTKSFFVFCILLFLSSMLPIPSYSLKIKLFPPNTPESPLYRVNLTMSKKFERLVHQSRSRAQVLKSRMLSSRNSKYRTQSVEIQPPVGGEDLGEFGGHVFSAQIGIGTFNEEPPSKTYFLALDTASSLTWLQCAPCQDARSTCFPQVDPIYPNTLSLSYVPFQKSEDVYGICDPQVSPNPDDCFYSVEYADGSKTVGQIAYEHFTFESSTEIICFENVVFGCGFNQTKMERIKPDKEAGVLGLDRGSISLRTQMDPDEKGFSFSYCFPDILIDEGATTYLRFGVDIVRAGVFQETPLVQVPDSQYFYHLTLNGLAVNGNNLGIDPTLFHKTIIDSGTAVTYLEKPVYEQLESFLIALFSANGNVGTLRF